MSKKYDFDYIVIGSGAAGSTAALKAAKEKKKVALIEADRWGGSTVNSRDIPYAASFKFSNLYAEAIHGSRFGISSSNLRYNYPTIANWRNLVIRKSNGNNKKFFEDAGITCYHSFGHFISPNEISVGQNRISGEKFLLATGSVPKNAGISGIEHVECQTPATVLNLNRPPKALFVIGGGSTGCEIAQYFAELGSKVLIADLTGRLLPREDKEIGETLGQYFSEHLGIKVLTSSRVVAVEQDSLSKRVIFMRGGQEKSVRVDAIVLATGSKPALDFGLENIGIKFDRHGVRVDKTLQTSLHHIYAAGDILGEDSSTERASYEGLLATGNAINRAKNITNYNGFMRITNTDPEIVQIGLSEDDCVRRARKCKKAIVYLPEIEASIINDFRYGFIKLLADKQKKIIGATIMAPQASLIAQEISLVIRHGLSAVELASTPHAINSWSELIRQAARKLAA